MKKVLMVFSGSYFTESPFVFARQLSLSGQVMVTGFFLPEIIDPPYEIHPAASTIDEGEQTVHKNISRFTELCENSGLGYRVHMGTYELSIPQLIKETRFSDLLITTYDIFNVTFGKKKAIHHFNKVISSSECPVIVVPKNFEYPENVLFYCDESTSSVYALKQFCYLFPDFSEKNIVVVDSGERTESTRVIKNRLTELVAAHFRNFKFIAGFTEKGKKITALLQRHRKTMFVTGVTKKTSGCFGVNNGNDWEINAPVFIANC